MSVYNDSDSDISSSDEDIDEHQIQLEFDKQANEEYLFKKASTNESVTSVGTKPYSIIASDTDDDTMETASDKPSPSKKQKQTDWTIGMPPSLVQNMMRYFERNNIDLSTLEISSATTATATATASLHTQDPETPAVSHPDVHMADATSNHEQDREPSHDGAVPPEPVTGSGDGL